MSKVFCDPTVLCDIPELGGTPGSPDGELSAVLVPVNGGNRLRCEVTELEDTVIISVPKIEAAVQGHRKNVLRRPL